MCGKMAEVKDKKHYDHRSIQDMPFKNGGKKIIIINKDLQILGITMHIN